MWHGKKVAVVFPAYNEEANIRKAIEDFFATEVIDEIIAVDNNSTDNTAAEIEKTRATCVKETRQGYGWALRRGLEEAMGDILFLCEPDGTFEARDVFKFLQYVDDFDAVLGTRTAKSMIAPNAKMGWLMRISNVAVAKFLEYMHGGPTLTDVGCTFRCIRREAYEQIRDQFRVGAAHFSVEFMIACIRNKLKLVEIPVHYKERRGQSKITANFWKSFRLAVVMMGLIMRLKFRRG